MTNVGGDKGEKAHVRLRPFGWEAALLQLAKDKLIIRKGRQGIFVV